MPRLVMFTALFLMGVPATAQLPPAAPPRAVIKARPPEPITPEEPDAVQIFRGINQYMIMPDRKVTPREGLSVRHEYPTYGWLQLHSHELRDELDFTAEQTRRYWEMHSGFGQRRYEIEKSFATPEALVNDPEARRNLYRALREQEYGMVADLLTPQQLRRYRQLCLQQMGPDAIGRKEIADALALSPSQRDRVRTAREKRMAAEKRLGEEWEERRKRGELPPAPARQPSNEERLRAVRDPNTPYNVMRREILGVLTLEQARKWQEMKGPVWKWLAHSRGYEY